VRQHGAALLRAEAGRSVPRIGSVRGARDGYLSCEVCKFHFVSFFRSFVRCIDTTVNIRIEIRLLVAIMKRRKRRVALRNETRREKRL